MNRQTFLGPIKESPDQSCLQASMDGHLILSAARRAVLNHGALLLSTHQGSIADHTAMQVSILSAPKPLS
jgi:hypothetical protein